MMLILITNIITFSDIYDNQPLIGFNVPTTVLIQAKTPNRAVENGVFHYPVGPFVFRVTAAFAISLI